MGDSHAMCWATLHPHSWRRWGNLGVCVLNTTQSSSWTKQVAAGFKQVNHKGKEPERRERELAYTLCLYNTRHCARGVDRGFLWGQYPDFLCADGKLKQRKWLLQGHSFQPINVDLGFEQRSVGTRVGYSPCFLPDPPQLVRFDHVLRIWHTPSNTVTSTIIVASSCLFL